MDLTLFYLLSFPFSVFLLFYFWFSFLLFFILDLGKEYSVILCMMGKKLLSSYHYLVWLALIGRNSNFIFLHFEQVNNEIEIYPRQENGRGSQENFTIFL